MEGLKGIIFDRGPAQMPDRKPGHAYLVAFVMITDKPLTGLHPGETIAIGNYKFVEPMRDAIEALPKYVCPFGAMGPIDHAILHVSHMDPADLQTVAEHLNREQDVGQD